MYRYGKSTYKRQRKRKAAAEKKAEAFIGESLVSWLPDFKDSSDYEEGRAQFHSLYQSGDADLRTIAWNQINPFSNPDDVDPSDFVEEEYNAICKKLRIAAENQKSGRNRNARIYTKRLILSPDDAEHSYEKQFQKQVRIDESFFDYVGFEPHNSDYDNFSMYYPFSFAICEKNEGRMVGQITFDVFEECHLAVACWYIFRHERKKGYAKEAVTALAQQAFAGRLYDTAHTWKDEVWRRKYVKIDLIRAQIAPENTASRALAESCGFEYQYIQRNVTPYTCESACVYELTAKP